MKYPRDRSHLPLLHDSTSTSRFLRELPVAVGPGTIVTVLGDAVRRKLDASIGDLKSLVHVQTVGEALHRVHEAQSSVLLISPDTLKPGETSLLERALSATTRAVAVLDEAPHDPAALLLLGACGLREAIDLRNCEGWNCLRQLLHDRTDPVAGRVSAILLHHLDGAAPGTRRFFEYLVHGARATRTVRALTDGLGIVPSTLMSRFHRAGLPSPKTILAATRLLFARALFERPQISISSVTFQLRYSSPRAFGRHVRLMLGMPVGEFRRSMSFERVAHLYLENLIVRHLPAYRTFDPFAAFDAANTVTPEEPGSLHLYH